jgi:lipoprotein-releasing system ATP-binding protein
MIAALESKKAGGSLAEAGGTPPISARGIGRDFAGPAGILRVLHGLDFELRPNEIVSVVGASGSGKSTLLHILGCLDRPTAGRLAVEGQETSHLSDRQLAALRGRHIGFVFQFHHLLPEFTALENAAIPMMVAGKPLDLSLKEAGRLLEMVELSPRAGHKPAELSGGEQQRAAIARALANSPRILLADEPTGNLDSKMGGAVIDLLWRLSSETGLAMVIVTHNREVAARAGRMLELREGKLWPA